ncbi:MAG: hypothetical protein KC496_11295 [Anaerolineae bacterium]|nr:hypothetical protein [Anaerolineae bacterium]
MQHNLKELERRAYRATFQDGLWDIYLGLVLIGFGSMPFLRNTVSEAASIVFYSALLVLAMTMLIGGKRSITVPRLGYVRFGKERQRKLSRARLLLIGSVAAGVLFFGLTLGNIVGLTGFSVLLAGALLIVFGGLAYFLDYHRLLLYAILCSLSLPVGIALENAGVVRDAPTVFILTGGLALLIGVILLQRFLSHYQLPPEDSLYG